MEPEFETELCDLKIEGGNQGDLLQDLAFPSAFHSSNLRWWRKEGVACAERGDGRRGDACGRY